MDPDQMPSMVFHTNTLPPADPDSTNCPSGEKHGRYNRVFYNALKMRDPKHVLLGANYAGASGVGPVQLAAPAG